MIFKIITRTLLLIILSIIGYWYYPLADTGPLTLEYPTIAESGAALEAAIAERESKIENLKPNNEARFVWADSTKRKTPYSIVYLHGFSASEHEGYPVHETIAKKYGMNMFLSRLSHHGTEGVESFDGMTADGLADSAMEAIAIGKQIGEKVILMGTSTGGTVGLMAQAFDPSLHAAIYYSPNIRIYDPNSALMRKPFGVQLAKYITGKEHYRMSKADLLKDYWTYEYRFEALPVLMELLDETMTEETFQKVKQPTLVLAYYKNEEEQDKVVSVKAIDEMVSQLGVPADKIVYKKLATVGNHVMTCDIQSSDIGVVVEETSDFIENVLGISSVENKLSLE